MIITKLQYLYTRRKLSVSSIEHYHFPVERSYVCISYVHFNFFPYKFQLNENAKALCLYCTDSKDTNIFVKVIQWDKLWYDFPVFTESHYGEQAVSFKMVDLPKSLTQDLHRYSGMDQCVCPAWKMICMCMSYVETAITRVAVSDRNQILFHCIF